MMRVCGAEAEKTPAIAANCWCRGTFCGKGGWVLSDKFRQEFKTSVTCRSLQEFAELVAQPDLFSGDDRRTWWMYRVDGSVLSWQRSRAHSSSRSSSSSSSG